VFLTPPADAIPSLVLMRLATPYAEGDLPFLNVQRYLALKKVPVPRVFQDEAAHGLVLLEDLGDLTLASAVQAASDESIRRWYGEALDILLTLQDASAPISRDRCVAFRLAFDVEKFLWELDFFVTHMLKQLCGRELSGATEAALRGQFWKLTAPLARQPRVLTHRDYHSRNLMLHEGHLRVIDFQDARLGPCHYDLASLLYDSYVVLPQDLRAQLLADYLQRKAETEGHGIDREEFSRLFEYMALQRNMKALGTFAFQAAVKGNPRYIPSIQPTIAYLQENLARHPELRVLGEILDEHLFAVYPSVLPTWLVDPPGE
jgi:aminoglycoside/choline kinase family phosphotransferase